MHPTRRSDDLQAALGVIAAPGRLTLIGSIQLLERRDDHGTGVIGLLTVRTPRRRYWVRLRLPIDYQIAERAHRGARAVRVRGYPAQEGSLRWLLDATVVDVLGQVEAPVDRQRSTSVGADDQLALFDA